MVRCGNRAGTLRPVHKQRTTIAAIRAGRRDRDRDDQGRFTSDDDDHRSYQGRGGSRDREYQGRFYKR